MKTVTRRLAWLFLTLMLVLTCSCGQQNSVASEEDQGQNGLLKTNPFSTSEWTDLVVYPDATILTMAVWAPDAALQMIIDEYNESHTDFQIQLKIYYEPQASDADVYKAIDRMTVDLMTGGAPDLFSLNSMDVMALKNADLLMDLYPLMEQDASFSLDDFYTNVWTQYEMNGCLYELVPCFEISGIIAPTALVGEQVGWTYDAWLELCQKETNLLDVSQTGLLDYMIQYSAGEFVDIDNGTCTFDSEQFLKWLKVIKSAPEKKDNTGNSIYKTASFVNGVFEYASSLSQMGTDITYCGFPSTDAQGPATVAFNSYGISATTEYPDACWEFLKYFLEDSVYERLEGEGFSAKRAVMEQQLVDAQLPLDDEDSLFYGYSSDEITPLSADQADYIRGVLESIDHCAFRYNAISDIINDEVGAYLANDKSAEDVAKIIQNRAGIYLSEQS